MSVHKGLYVVVGIQEELCFSTEHGQVIKVEVPVFCGWMTHRKTEVETLA